MKSYSVMAYCDSGRTKLDGWKPPQKIVTGANEKYAIELVKEWIHHQPQMFDIYCICVESNIPGCSRYVLRVQYVVQRMFNLRNSDTWQLLELKEEIPSD